MTYRYLSRAAAVLLGLTVAGPVSAGGPKPYPPSPIIKGVTIEPQRQSIGDGDNWPITWADDDAQYTVYCDGKGFGGGSGSGSMRLAKVLGMPPNVTGQNILSPSGHKTGSWWAGVDATGNGNVAGTQGQRALWASLAI